MSSGGEPTSHISPIQVREKYNEVFEVELECWCYGLSKFPGELSPALIHRVIKEIAPLFSNSIEHNYIFNLQAVAKQVGEACNNIIGEKEIIFGILAQLPAPFELSEDGQFVLAQIVDQAEQLYGGVIERLEKRWKGTREKKRPSANTVIVRQDGKVGAPPANTPKTAATVNS